MNLLLPLWITIQHCLVLKHGAQGPLTSPSDCTRLASCETRWIVSSVFQFCMGLGWDKLDREWGEGQHFCLRLVIPAEKTHVWMSGCQGSGSDPRLAVTVEKNAGATITLLVKVNYFGCGIYFHISLMGKPGCQLNFLSKIFHLCQCVTSLFVHGESALLNCTSLEQILNSWFSNQEIQDLVFMSLSSIISIQSRCIDLFPTKHLN